MTGFTGSDNSTTEPPCLPDTVAEALACADSVRTLSGGHMNRTEVSLQLLAAEVRRLRPELDAKKRKEQKA